MNRQEFIRELRKSMSGHFSASEIQETVDYYEDYIDLQMKKGRTEGEILSELGDPRLLTKSMKAAGKGNESYREYGSDVGVHGKVVRIPCLIWVAIGIIIMLIIGAIVGLALRIFLYLFPVILIAGGLYWLYHNFIKK